MFFAAAEAQTNHYDVDLERASEGYCLPDEDEAALAEVQRLDTAAGGPSAVLASSFEVEILRPCRRPRPGQIPPKVESTPRVLLLPLLMAEPAGTVCL